MTTELTGAAEPVLADPMPDELSWPRLARRAAALLVLLAAVAAAVALLPGLEPLRDGFGEAKPAWIAVGAVLQIGSALSCVAAFRAVFCRRMSWRTSYEIATAELATNSLLSVGGAGGLALGAWILRRGGMNPNHIARRTVAFFLLTSLANVSALIVAGLGLGLGLLNGGASPVLAFVPAAVGMAGIGLILGLRPLARLLAARTGRKNLAAGLEHLAAGVDEALVLLRRGDPRLIAGALGYMLFDVAMLGVAFAAFGNHAPAGGVLLMAYLIGQLGSLIPLPGGVGGVDGGLIGTLMLYGTGAAAAATAVIAYRALVLLVPLAMGLPAIVVLEGRLRRESHDIATCGPGDEVEILGRGRVAGAQLSRR